MNVDNLLSCNAHLIIFTCILHNINIKLLLLLRLNDRLIKVLVSQVWSNCGTPCLDLEQLVMIVTLDLPRLQVSFLLHHSS